MFGSWPEGEFLPIPVGFSKSIPMRTGSRWSDCAGGFSESPRTWSAIFRPSFAISGRGSEVTGLVHSILYCDADPSWLHVWEIRGVQENLGGINQVLLTRHGNLTYGGSGGVELALWSSKKGALECLVA